MAIRVLPDDVANKIAAGEVVERPASVVKELIDNSLDAAAREIRVEVREGGKRLVRVQDDGHGMDREDAELSLKRHATSKLTAAEDLHVIDTLGFRGEAIPSIASVARFEMLTRTAESIEGTRAVVDGGKSPEVAPVGCPVGTRITVENLFANVPARLKFLKTDTTELNHTVNHVQWAALAHPNVRFVLTHNDRTLIDVAASDTRAERIRLLYGKEFADSLIAFTKSFESMDIECHIGNADLSRPNRSHQFFFVNGRAIRDRTVSAAVSEALREVVPKGRYPVAFLFLRMDADRVDVNVHPTKAEVRFQDERGLFRNIVQAVAQGIAESKYIPTIQTADDPAEQHGAPARVNNGDAPMVYPKPRSHSIIPPSRARYGDPPPATGLSGRPGPAADRQAGGPASTWTSATPARGRLGTPVVTAATGSGAIDIELLDFEGLELVGVLYNTYILVADTESLYYIDQHVAAERVNYERIVTRMRAGAVASQGLLTPISVELSPDRKVRFDAHRQWLSRFGIEAESFGGDTALIRAIPATLDSGEAEQMFKDLLDRVESELHPERSWEVIQERVAATIACHSSVRAGDPLTTDEVRALLSDLSKARLPFNCPHGRPVIISMPRMEIESRFQRR
ncbi:DNA mismatch repair endonuclease MutL [Candidatus Poribacteria bacterium]|nr:DNA mismatch repair endonuclease MutL [Candidatus Poribacteria bacterium]MBT5535827.1 DNA mismatch repair endonuclease MutL [Candidatus Poribacteria bacterium]MBT5711131.1 DNA mismatch repair endonuclease MutL [Candidatus Poribacteria bacterium]MBT7101148.1 DNA mismatch repair endonuclease MutL [Candidatus Poribacteria bacterium]MBT7805670.1 DNA mismatch repair endonuclease MutL [Candidatus Poribacteria bacterium]